MNRTAEELINKAASILGKYVPGEALGDVEHTTISKAYDDVIAEIGRIVSFDRNEVPDIFFETVARLTAVHSASEFSNQPPDQSMIFALEQRLRVLAAETPTYAILGTYHF